MPNTIQQQTLPETGFIRLPQVLQVIPVGKSTWWAGIQSGRFPKGYKLGPRTTAWRAEDIRQLLENLTNQ
ncbi:AlpA family phage regulatory protein [Oceanospirillaceae bacterium]|nr:AlpA family phage regulatory protein [Oceanospirillaceae bacterium]